MEKPFSIRCEEFKQRLAYLINNSNLPVYVVELVLQNYLSEINNITKEQYNVDKELYEKSLREVNDGDKNEYDKRTI